MELKFTYPLKMKLLAELELIAQDKPDEARRFQNQLLEALKATSKEPLRNRKSIYFKSPKMRDLVLKGYIIVHEVDLIKEEITVFSMVTFQKDSI